MARARARLVLAIQVAALGWPAASFAARDCDGRWYELTEALKVGTTPCTCNEIPAIEQYIARKEREIGELETIKKEAESGDVGGKEVNRKLEEVESRTVHDLHVGGKIDYKNFNCFVLLCEEEVTGLCDILWMSSFIHEKRHCKDYEPVPGLLQAIMLGTGIGYGEFVAKSEINARRDEIAFLKEKLAQLEDLCTQELRADIMVTWSGKVHGNDAETKVDDDITVTWTAKVARPASLAGKAWEVDTGTEDWGWSVSGGGKARAGQHSQSWSYETRGTVRGSGAMWPLRVDEGSYEITVPSLGEVFIEPVIDTTVAPPNAIADAIEKTVASTALALLAGAARNTLASVEARAGLDEGFRARLRGTFDPRVPSFARSGSASVSASQPMAGGAMSATLTVTYTVGFGPRPEKRPAARP